MTVLCILCHVYTTLPFSVPKFKIYFQNIFGDLSVETVYKAHK